MKKLIMCAGALMLAASLLCSCTESASSASVSQADSVASSQESSGTTDEVVQFASGQVTAVGMSAVTIQDEDGQELSFATDGVDMPENVQVGDTIIIHYTGDIVDGNTSESTIVSVERVDGSGTDSAEEVQFASGPVVAVGMSAVTIQDEDGQELSFITDEVEMPQNLQEGENIIIHYTGNVVDGDTSGVTLIDVVRAS